MTHLSNNTLNKLPASLILPPKLRGTNENNIVHIGIGGFHRSHQAYAIAQLLALDPSSYESWRITGVGLMPNDKLLIDDFRKQNHLYALRTVAANKSEEVRIINAISETLHAEEDTDKIINKLACKTTLIISFTITEGGYNYDFKNDCFMIENNFIQHDLDYCKTPKTVFGFLARGLQKRRELGNGGLTLLSCDNIIGNGRVLKNAVLSFLSVYDLDLKNWAEQNILFPNSMVDRITPVPNNDDKKAFEYEYGIRDNCVVVSEDYFQWVIEDSVLDSNFPPLDKVGVEFVDNVAMYEEMKLGILNAGHTLVGLLGYALGYKTIHEAVNDPDIATTYEQFCFQEVIPVLSKIDNIDYESYFFKVKTRFSNAMINDSTARIIAGSSDKFPKFVLPIVQKQFKSSEAKVSYSALITAAWWAYLNKEMKRNQMEDVNDQLLHKWKVIFHDEDNSIDNFISCQEVFFDLAKEEKFIESYYSSVSAFQQGHLRAHLQFINNNNTK